MESANITRGHYGIGEAEPVVSLCPYCAVGCSTLAYVSDDGKLLDVEGNPDSPLSAGHLCPKGAAVFGLAVNDARLADHLAGLVAESDELEIAATLRDPQELRGALPRSDVDAVLVHDRLDD